MFWKDTDLFHAFRVSAASTVCVLLVIVMACLVGGILGEVGMVACDARASWPAIDAYELERCPSARLTCSRIGIFSNSSLMASLTAVTVFVESLAIGSVCVAAAVVLVACG